MIKYFVHFYFQLFVHFYIDFNSYELFHKIFPVILTDNGKDFKRPELIEDNGSDVVKTKVFYCDSRRSDQKGSIGVSIDI